MHLPNTISGLRSILLVAGVLASFIPAEAQITAPPNPPGAVVATNSVSAETPPPASVTATNQPAQVPPPAWATADAPATVTNQQSEVVAKTAPANNLIDSLREKAEAGDAKSQCALGDRYEDGIGLEKDAVEAVKWFSKAADQGYASAQFHLFGAYASGDEVEKNAVEAVLKRYRIAADQGDAMAQCNLGICYALGTGVEKNQLEAAKWFRNSADQGNAEAECNLGSCYLNGKGVAKDVGEAVKWYRIAADQGFAKAQFQLGACYYTGTGVEKDVVEAAKWFRKAADQGDLEAQSILGRYAADSCVDGLFEGLVLGLLEFGFLWLLYAMFKGVMRGEGKIRSFCLWGIALGLSVLLASFLALNLRKFDILFPKNDEINSYNLALGENQYTGTREQVFRVFPETKSEYENFTSVFVVIFVTCATGIFIFRDKTFKSISAQKNGYCGGPHDQEDHKAATIEEQAKAAEVAAIKAVQEDLAKEQAADAVPEPKIHEKPAPTRKAES